MSVTTSAGTRRWITLHEAVCIVKKQTGRNVSYSAVFRWTRQGSRGHRLESRLIGSRVYTTEKAIVDFLRALERDREQESRRLHERSAGTFRARRRTEAAKAKAISRARCSFRGHR